MEEREATAEDAAPVAELIRRLSRPFLLSPSGSGAERFFASISEDAIRRYIRADNFAYRVVLDRDELVAAVALRDNAHLYHLFVAESHQRQGLGRRLWDSIRRASLQAGNPGVFTVNSSLDAVPFYQGLGFVKIGRAVRRHGVAFVRMKLVLGTLE